MPILELYSTRNKGIYPDTYQYEYPSEKLRMQIAKIIGDAIGKEEHYFSGYGTEASPSNELFNFAHELLSKEYGKETLNNYSRGHYKWAKKLLCHEGNVECFLDALELFCTLILSHVEPNFNSFSIKGGANQKPRDAINEINERMKRDGFGYEYLDGIIIRVDQAFIHSEVTKPALYLLSKFEGARHEFLSAHEHYRHERYEEALNDCNKSLESLLKNVCENEHWDYKKGTVNALIPICMENGLILSCVCK